MINKPNVFLYIYCIVLFTQCTETSKSDSVSESEPINEPWKMHHINDYYVIANSLNAADVDKDGYMDYAVIDEWLGIQTILFHPGKDGDIRAKWDRVNLGKTGNPEYSCLGDLDEDGNVDFIVVTGDALEVGYSTGVGLFWGPDADKVRDSTAWEYAGYFPATLGQQYLYAECHDINNDGAVDILVGGRRNAITNEYAGIRWLEAPTALKDRRDLSKWKTHFIDADAYSGHGFVLTDVNNDGFEDIMIADADWDTPAFEEKLVWYQNPGDASLINQEWKMNEIWKSNAFYPKPQFGIGDLNKDGLDDVVTQTQNFINLHLRSMSGDTMKWERIKIKKPEMIQWIGRPIKLVDINQDGNLDIVGMLIHNDGNLPANKASVFWMEYKGDSPGEEWDIHPIKWSDGYNSYHEWIGEKWDHCLFLDMDQDGDLDIVGNVEEHYRYVEGKELPESFFSVVWFENPLKN